MAEDLVMHWLVRLRDISNNRVPDISLLNVARRLGGVSGDKPLESKYYREKEQIDDSVLEKIVDGLKEAYNKDRVVPGENVGVIAAHSISEPGTQMTMRTFHYAGVANTVNPLDAMIAEQSMVRRIYTMGLALGEDIKLDREKAEKLRFGVMRTKLGDVCDIDFIDYESQDDIVITMKKKSSEDSDEEWAALNSDNRFPSSDELVEAFQTVFFFNYAGDRRSDPATRGMEMPGLRSNISVGKNEDDSVFVRMPHFPARYRTSLLHLLHNLEICNNCSYPIQYMKTQHHSEKTKVISRDDESVPSNEDYLAMAKNYMDFVESGDIGQIGFVEDLAPKNRESLADDAVAEDLFEKIVEASNDSEVENFEELSYGSPEWALGIRKLWTATPAHYTLELATQTDFKCCRRCGLGWQLASATLRQVGDIDIDYLMSEDISITDKTKVKDGFTNLYSQLTKIADHPLDDVNYEIVSKGDSKGKQIPSDVYEGVYPGSGREGSLTDYPIQTMSSGRGIAGGVEGEYFLYVVGSDTRGSSDFVSSLLSGPAARSYFNSPIANGKGFSKDVWKDKQRASFAGYFALTDGDDRFDFMRSTCDDPRQVYHALGIEPARMVLLENLYHIETNSDADIAEFGISSAGLGVHISHMSLLIDALCSGTTMTTIRSQSSIQGGQGIVSRKGSISKQLPDGSLVNYGEMLAIASYETANRVLMDASLMGVVDRIRSLKGVQIVGNFENIGFDGTPHRSKGENLHLVDELIALQGVKGTKGIGGLKKQIIDEMDSYVSELFSEGYTITGMMELREYGPQFAQSDKFAILARDPEFLELKSKLKRVLARIEEIRNILAI
tara:strand:- start:12398 stop:14917 length:2520 start_codon:yes stop_codon:yes gene_type:complete